MSSCCFLSFLIINTLKIFYLVYLFPRVVSSGLPKGHISHIFLDECGHSMEPEALVPLSGLATKETQVVLAGDPHQLGPVIRNPQAFSAHNLFKKNGLGEDC